MFVCVLLGLARRCVDPLLCYRYYCCLTPLYASAFEHVVFSCILQSSLYSTFGTGTSAQYFELSRDVAEAPKKSLHPHASGV